MMRILATLAFVVLAACSQPQEEAPKPFALDEEAIGRYCGMNVLEHDGPKGQIILSQIPEPIWFSSARDAVAFTLLPDEPKNIAAIYVSDMAAAESWEKPGAENWIDARAAFYVIGSARLGGMGVAEAIPFSTREAALDFARENGGEVVDFSGIPPAYVLGGGEETDDTAEPQPHATEH